MNQISRKTIKAYDQLGENYLSKIEKYPLKEIEDFIELLPDHARVLDIGCAGGRETIQFVKNNFETTGIDLNKNFIKYAHDRIPEAKFYTMDLRKLSFPDNHFDGIWASAVLIHLQKEDLENVLKKINKILRFHGKLFVSVKKGIGEKYVTDDFSGKIQRFFSFYQEREIINYLTKTGFKIIFKKIEDDAANRKDITWIKIIAEKM